MQFLNKICFNLCEFKIRHAQTGWVVKSPAREEKQLLSDETLGMSVDKEVSLHYIHCVSGFITDCLKSQKIHADFKKQAEEPGSLQHDIMLQKFLKIVSFVTTNNMGPGRVSTEMCPLKYHTPSY